MSEPTIQFKARSQRPGRPPLGYLAGAIEYAPDGGLGWREAITPFLHYDLGHQVYDPAKDARKSLTEEESENLRLWKESDFPRFQAAVRKIIEFDLDVISRSDYVICCWDEHVTKGGGTAAEVTSAFRLGIPVYLVTSLPVSTISGWILACCAGIFNGFEELKVYLRHTYSQRV
jgi:hypothetical protein